MLPVQARDPDTYLRTALAMGCAGGVGTLVVKGLISVEAFRWLPVPSLCLSLLFALIVFAGVAFSRTGDAALGRLWWAIPIAAATALTAFQTTFPAFGILLFGAFFGLALGWDPSAGKARIAVTTVTVGAFTLLGAFLFGSFAAIAGLASSVPPLVLDTLLGGLLGFFVATGAAPRHVGFKEPDPVELEYRKAEGLLRGNLRAHVRQSMTVYRNIHGIISISPADPQEELTEVHNNLREIMLDTFNLAIRWQEVETFLSRLDLGDLRKRLLQAEEKIEGTQDAFTRDQYEKIQASLQRRMEQFQRLRTAKERVVSRLSYYQTALEEMHLAVIKLKSSSAQLDSLALSSLFDKMESLSQDMEAAAQALDDLNFEPSDPRQLSDA